jgi:hypothetical protein
MSQYIPNTAVSRLTSSSSTVGSADQPGTPAWRPSVSAARPNNRMRPVRWPATSASRPAVTIVIPSVAPITWPIAAPRAGG